MAVHLEPVGADKMMVVKHGVIGTQEVEILKLKIYSQIRTDSGYFVVDFSLAVTVKVTPCLFIPSYFVCLPEHSRIVQIRQAASIKGNNVSQDKLTLADFIQQKSGND